MRRKFGPGLASRALPGHRVELPVIMPKPNLTALTGDYCKTPVLQIGARMESGFGQQQRLGFSTFSSKRSGSGPPERLCMSGTTHGATWLQRTSVSTRYVSSLAWKYWDAFQVRGDARNYAPPCSV